VVLVGQVLLAAPRSFCAGVDRAIEIVEILLEKHGPPVYVRHEIVHNDHVVRRLERLGAVFVDHEDAIPAGAICVLSAHGVAPSVRENCERRGLVVVDPSARSSRRCTPRPGATPTAATWWPSWATPTTSR
jgi:4-hydroxy-3-methylbut-2-enyl diphosphate reductase